MRRAPATPPETTLREPLRVRRLEPSGGEGRLLLGRYRALERLGAGGFGVVWRARDEWLGREVAVKLVPLADGERARAEREAIAAARLSHPAIVALHEAAEEGGELALISELVEGSTLARLIAGDELDDREIIAIGSALCSALTHAHERGVVHRDIKPQNVLVPDRTDGRAAAKLADFGGASLAGEEALTRSGDVLGTLAYMAPEQLDGGEVDERSDLYSLALVLYEAFSGENPVRGATPAATVRQVGEPIAPLASRRPDLARTLAAAIDRALDADPDERGEVAELAGALERARPAARGRIVPRRRAAGEGYPDAGAAAAAPQRTLPRVPAALAALAAAALCVWQWAAGRPGLALLLAAGLAPLCLLPGRRGRVGAGRPLAVLAPALGAAGLAGCWPALAGQQRCWRERVACGMLGMWWLALAAPLAARALWLPAARAPADWAASAPATLHAVIEPALTTATLLAVLLWGAAAAALPLLVRGAGALRDTLGAVLWAALLAAATLRAQAALAPAAPVPHGLLAASALGAGVALLCRALRGPV